jgi:hypothetical protein
MAPTAVATSAAAAAAQPALAAGDPSSWLAVILHAAPNAWDHAISL